jgi:hypothetical protein
MSRKGEAALRKTVYGAALAAGLFVMSARAEDQPAAKCAYREEAVAASAPAAAVAHATTKKDKHLVTLLAVTPAEGAEVRATSVLELDVEYHIADFAPDKFFLMVGFPTNSLGLMSPGERDDFHILRSPSGKAHLCVPLQEVYEHRGVQWPLSFQVNINEQFTGHSEIVASSRKAQLNSVDVPAGALEMQNQAPPEDVQRALMMVFGYVETQGALNKVCPARFPDLQATFIKTYRAWETRNSANIKQVQAMQYDAFSSTMQTPASAANAFDATREATVKYLSALEDSKLRPVCKSAIESLGDETGDLPTATAVNFEVVQDYLASKRKAEGAK